MVHSGYLCYPGAWLVWRIGLAVKWVGKEMKPITIIVSGDLQKQLQCLKLCEYLCVHVCAHVCIFRWYETFRDSTRNFDGAELRLLGWMVFCNFDADTFAEGMLWWFSVAALFLSYCQVIVRKRHSSVRYVPYSHWI